MSLIEDKLQRQQVFTTRARVAIDPNYISIGHSSYVAANIVKITLLAVIPNIVL